MRLELLNNQLDPGIVLGWMLFPNSPHLRELYLARHGLGQVVSESEPEEKLRIPARLMEQILAGPGREEMRRLATEATKRGVVAGDLLALISEQQHLGKPASKDRAIRHYKEWALGKRYGDDEALKISRQTLFTYFDEFRSVAHLWAAHRVNQFSIQPVDAFGDPIGLRILLGVAKSFGTFAATHTPPNTKGFAPLIPAECLLQLPIEIPELPIPRGELRPI